MERNPDGTESRWDGMGDRMDTSGTGWDTLRMGVQLPYLGWLTRRHKGDERTDPATKGADSPPGSKDAQVVVEGTDQSMGGRGDG